MEGLGGCWRVLEGFFWVLGVVGLKAVGYSRAIPAWKQGQHPEEDAVDEGVQHQGRKPLVWESRVVCGTNAQGSGPGVQCVVVIKVMAEGSRFRVSALGQRLSIERLHFLVLAGF